MANTSTNLTIINIINNNIVVVVVVIMLACSQPNGLIDFDGGHYIGPKLSSNLARSCMRSHNGRCREPSFKGISVK